MLAMLVPIVWIGVYPSPFLRRLDASRRRPAAPDGAEEGGSASTAARRTSCVADVPIRGGGVAMNAPRLDLAAIAPIAFTGHRRAGRAARRGVALAAQDLPRPRRHRSLDRHRARDGRRRSSSASRSTRPAPPSRAARASPSTSTTRCCASTRFARLRDGADRRRVVPGLLALDRVSRRAAHQPRRVLRAAPALDRRHVPAGRRRSTCSRSSSASS